MYVSVLTVPGSKGTMTSWRGQGCEGPSGLLSETWTPSSRRWVTPESRGLHAESRSNRTPQMDDPVTLKRM